MPQHERATFTTGREVIEHAVDYLTRIRDRLDEARERDHPERVTLLLNSMEAEQRNLLGAIERFLEDASHKVLDTYAQYTVELPTTIEGPEEPLTPLGLFQWLQELNSHLHDMFAELSGKGDSEELANVFGGIAQHVQSHEKRLSKEYQRFQDL